MAKFKDLTGCWFGKLRVARRAPNSGRRVAWLCLCSCGKKKVITSGSLCSGRVKGCGCVRIEQLVERARARKKTDAKTLAARRRRRIAEQYRRHILAMYGLTVQQLRKMKRAQNYRCAICQRKTKLHVDHCHASQRVRGLLCQLCNRMLGLSRDKTSTLRDAISYLENYK